MQFINESNNQYFQWSKSAESKFCLVDTHFGDGDNFIKLISLFLKFRSENENSVLKKLCIVSFSPIDITILNTIKTIRNSSTKRLINTLREQLPPPVSGCHRLIFEDGVIQLDLWLGDLINQFDNAFNKTNQSQTQAVINTWFIQEEKISAWSQKEIPPFFKNIRRASKPDASLILYNGSGLLNQAISDIGFTLNKGPSDQSTYSLNSSYDIKQQEYSASNQMTDIAIIGGGIASLCTAISLAKRGKSVTLYCSESKLGTGASGNLQGALYPLINGQHDELSQLFTNAYLYALNFYNDVNINHPFSHQFNGLIQLGYDISATKKLLKIKNAKLPDQITHWVKDDELDKLAGINVGLEGLHYPNGGWLSPRELIQSLHQQLMSYDNVKILFDHRIESITHLSQLANSKSNAKELSTQRGWQLTKKSNTNNTQMIIKYNHQAIVIAAGMDTLKFGQCRAIPLSAARGQVSHIKSNSVLSPLKRTLCHEGYLTPQMNGLHCMGATFKRHDKDNQYREHEQLENHLKLKKCIPNKKWVDSITTNTEAHVGIRCTTRDHFPYVGALSDYDTIKNNYELNNKAAQGYPELPNIYLLTGLGSRGLCTAPLLAEVIASKINNEPLPISDQIYRKMEIPRQWRTYIRKNRPLKE